MRDHSARDRWLGLAFLVFAALLVFLWVPLDTETGLVEKVRRRLTIGDALGPTVAGTVIAIGAVLTLLRPQSGSVAGGRGHLVWLAALFGLFLVSMITMRFAGPLAASLTEGGYRPLRDTVPWKYIGFVLGGTIMVAGLVSLVDRQVTLRAIVLGFVASLVLALLYDLPFEDILLPPNGDV